MKKNIYIWTIRSFVLYEYLYGFYMFCFYMSIFVWLVKRSFSYLSETRQILIFV